MNRRGIPLDVQVELEGQPHAGLLRLPANATGLVLFAHGSGSSRLSRRNNFVADLLEAAGIASLLFDLLTEAEDADYENRFDIGLLGRRLLAATAWAGAEPRLGGLAFGYFGASTGAAAALLAAVEARERIGAVVSRGGRPDLAGPALARVRAPTLLVVGARDPVVLDLNRAAFAQLSCTKALEIVPGASHLFEEPGTLQAAAGLAIDWFERYLPARPPPGL